MVYLAIVIVGGLLWWMVAVVVFVAPSGYFGLGKLSIQTAGFSGTSSSGVKVARTVIFGVKNFEEIKDIINNYAKSNKPEALEAEAETKPTKDINNQVLRELRKIRRTLEK